MAQRNRERQLTRSVGARHRLTAFTSVRSASMLRRGDGCVVVCAVGVPRSRPVYAQVVVVVQLVDVTVKGTLVQTTCKVLAFLGLGLGPRDGCSGSRVARLR